MAKRWEERIADLDKAIKRLGDAIEESKVIESSTLQDGVIQRFEFTLELSWKVMKYYLNSEGVIEAKAPRSTVRQGFVYGIIEDANIWMDMIEDRNLTTHTYSESMANTIYLKIRDGYYKELRTFFEGIKDKEVE